MPMKSRNSIIGIQKRQIELKPKIIFRLIFNRIRIPNIILFSLQRSNCSDYYYKTSNFSCEFIFFFRFNFFKILSCGKRDGVGIRMVALKIQRIRFRWRRPVESFFFTFSYGENKSNECCTSWQVSQIYFGSVLPPAQHNTIRTRRILQRGSFFSLVSIYFSFRLWPK